MKKLLTVILSLILVMMFMFSGCENKDFNSTNNYDVINDGGKFDKILLSDTSLNTLINEISISYFRSVSKDILYIDDIQDIADFSQIKKIEYDNKEYYYNVFSYNNADIIITYLLMDKSLVMDNVFVCGEKTSYNSIQDKKYSYQEDSLSKLQSISGEFINTKINNDITQNSDITHLIEYYTDEGFAYVGYNASTKFIGKFLVTNCIYEKLYDSYEQQVN